MANQRVAIDSKFHTAVNRLAERISASFFKASA